MQLNWYKFAVLQSKDREYPVAAIVSIYNRFFEGNSHAEALQKAINAGYAYYDDKNTLRDKDNKEINYSGNLDLFRTNKGRIIGRNESFDLDGATSSEYIPEEELDTLDKIVKKYEDIGARISVYDNGKNTITLQDLRINKDNRGQGIGSNFMKDLCNYADKTKKDIELNLAEKERGETTSKGRLIEFYKTFGFVRNFGRTKDYSRSCQMYRKFK